MSPRYPNTYAPAGSCKYCGFTGQDWGFKYHPTSCTRCYTKWMKQQRAEHKRLHPNVNVSISDKITVTSNVERRLYRRANKDIPHSSLSKLSDAMMMIGGLFIILPLFIAIFTGVPSPGYIWIICIAVANIIIWGFGYVSDKEYKKRKILLDHRLLEIAEERQKQIDEMKAFYRSPEWRLLRNKIIKAHKNVCLSCGKTITEKSDITVDHIMPRSKFPEKALEVSNMQILCRSCNSSKGDRFSE